MGYRHIINQTYTDQPVVYQMNIGTRLYIWKGKSPKQSISSICDDIDRFLRKGVPEDHLLKKVVDYIKRARPAVINVDILKQTDNLTELLEFEELTLKQNSTNEKCLNISFKPHVPKWIEEELAKNIKPAAAAKNKIPANQNKPVTGIISPAATRLPSVHSKVAAKGTENTSERKSAMMIALEKLKNK